MHERTVADDGEEQRPADAATRVVGSLFANDQQLVQPRCDGELLPLDSGKRFEAGSGRGAAPRAVAVRRVPKRVRYLVANCAALTTSDEALQTCSPFCELVQFPQKGRTSIVPA